MRKFERPRLLQICFLATLSLIGSCGPVFIDNQPLQMPEEVVSVDAEGTLTLASGERVRIVDTSERAGEYLLGFYLAGVSGHVGLDVENSGWEVDIERLGKDPDGVTRAIVYVRVDNRVRVFRPRPVKGRIPKYGRMRMYRLTRGACCGGPHHKKAKH